MNYRDEIIVGHAVDALREVPEGIFQCCVTSPPYWGLRDYGTARWEGGDAECDHIEREGRNDISPEALARRAALFGTGTQAGSLVSPKQYRDICAKCGAHRIDQQLGLEPDIEEYVANMVAVGREVWRVLREDGLFWIVIGDSYATSSTGNRGTKSGLHGAESEVYKRTLDEYTKAKRNRAAIPAGLKPKDLCMIPARVAIALQSDGWYLRSDIIWDKSNCCMPESVIDRCTSAHEHVFMLSKNKKYYYDAEAIQEPNSPDMLQRAALGYTRGPNGRCDASRHDSDSLRGRSNMEITANGRNRRNVWHINTQSSNWDYCDECQTLYNGPERSNIIEYEVENKKVRECPNCHSTSAWVNHFAAYPRELVELCIKAGTRQVTDGEMDIVLDPFVGSGTTAIVAKMLCRGYCGIDINEKYARVARARLKRVQGQYKMF